jgi:type II secretory ATPase GspE/PulE/Tfp pilus assembly ATPase PilB-like protein
MAEMNIAERRLPQDGRVRLRILGKKVDLRVSTIPTIYGESVVMRILDRSSIMLSLDELGFPSKSKKSFETLIRKPHGIILVTGPTGSGKTTTLYGALDKINSPDKKIITVEDPIEYQLSGVNQIQVKPKIGLTFASGLRSIVRQDPDIMMVGEIRDLETAEIAIQSALTGHLVFSTLHTNDAPGAITRLLDMGVEHYLAASCLEGVLAQRLVRVICKKCSAKKKPDKQTLKLMELKTAGKLKISMGQGCKDCNFTGYRGRLGIFELLLVNDEIRHLILKKTSANVIRKKAIAMGMATLREDGWQKVKDGITSVEEVLRVTQEEDLEI